MAAMVIHQPTPRLVDVAALQLLYEVKQAATLARTMAIPTPAAIPIRAHVERGRAFIRIEWRFRPPIIGFALAGDPLQPQGDERLLPVCVPANGV